MAVPYTFASSTSTIPLANLDSNFSYFADAITVSSGNVGIGTTTTAQKLNIDGGIQLYGANNTRGLYWNMYGTANSGYIDINGAVDGNIMRFGTQNTERMRIDGNGNIIIGSTAVIDPSTKLNVYSSSSWGTGMVAQNGSGNIFMTNYSGTGAYTAIGFYNSGFASPAYCGAITVSGTTTTYGTSSDYRLKENVAPIIRALDTVAQLKPVTYKWKSDGSDGQGFIAHELQAVVPDCVTGEKDEVDEEGKPKYQGVDTSFLVATLTAAIQELNAKVIALEAKLASNE